MTETEALERFNEATTSADRVSAINACVDIFHTNVLDALARGDLKEANAITERARGLPIAYAYCRDALRLHKE